MFTALLVVVTFSELQKGQALGALVASGDSEGWVYTGSPFSAVDSGSGRAAVRLSTDG
jgi:hypothetical protein